MAEDAGGKVTACSKKPVMLTLKRSILICQRSDYLRGSSVRWGRFRQVKRKEEQRGSVNSMLSGDGG